MTQLPSTKNLSEALDYDPQTGVFTWKPRADKAWNSRWAGREAFISNTHGYRSGSLFGKTGVLAHRVAWKMYHGADPIGEVDHINGDRADNRIANLRVVTSLQNKQNASIPSHNTSGVMGVRYRGDRNRWVAFISKNNRTKILGHFESRDAAIAVRKEAELRLGFHENHGRPR